MNNNYLSSLEESISEAVINKIEGVDASNFAAETLNILKQEIRGVIKQTIDISKLPPEQWRIDVNGRYQTAVGIVSSLATASLVLPIFFLKDFVKVDNPQSLIHSGLVSWCWVICGWISLGLSVLAAVIYYYSSAKWVKLAWHQDADLFGCKHLAGQSGKTFIENALDWSYGIMMGLFILGMISMITFMLTAQIK